MKSLYDLLSDADVTISKIDVINSFLSEMSVTDPAEEDKIYFLSCNLKAAAEDLRRIIDEAHPFACTNTTEP